MSQLAAFGGLALVCLALISSLGCTPANDPAAEGPIYQAVLLEFAADAAPEERVFVHPGTLPADTMGRPVPWDRGDLYLTERHDGIVRAADADARVALCRLAADRSCEIEPGMRLAILSEIHWTGDDRADLWVWDVVLDERYIHTSVIAVTVDRKDDARWEVTRWDPFFFES